MSSTTILSGRRWCALLIHWPGRSASAARFSGRLNRSSRSAHLAGRGGRPSDRPVTDQPAHCGIAAEPLGVVHVLVAGEPSEHQLARQTDQQVTTVLAGARVGERVATRVGQPEGVIQLAIGQQSRIGGDHAAAKLKQQTTVEIEPQRTPVRFTRRVRHRHPVRSPTSCGILILDRCQRAQDRRFIWRMRVQMRSANSFSIFRNR
jgi:hypothetical protein